jgi:hypothetical protein
LTRSASSPGRGKQELPPALLEKARLLCDLPTRSVAIGEFQNIADLVADGTLRLDALGDVLTGKAEGRVRLHVRSAVRARGGTTRSFSSEALRRSSHRRTAPAAARDPASALGANWWQIMATFRDMQVHFRRLLRDVTARRAKG